MIRFPVGLRYMAASALSFSLMSVLVKVAGRTLPIMEVVLARAVITLLLSVWMLRRIDVSFWGEERGYLWLRGVFGFIALSCFYYAIVQLPLAEVTVIHYTNPVFTALGAALFLAESLRALELVLAVVSLGGVALVARPSFLFGGEVAALDPLGVAAAVAGALFSAAAYVTVRRASRSNHHMVIVFYFALVATLGAVPFAAPVWEWPTGMEWIVLLGIGGMTQLGQVFLTKGLERERAGRAMNVGYLQIVFAAVWGALFFDEIPDLWSVAGGLVIIGSTLLLARTRGGPGSAVEGADTESENSSGRVGP